MACLLKRPCALEKFVCSTVVGYSWIYCSNVKSERLTVLLNLLFLSGRVCVCGRGAPLLDGPVTERAVVSSYDDVSV